MANTTAPAWATRRVELLKTMLIEPAVQSIFADLREEIISSDKNIESLEHDEAAKQAVGLAKVRLKLSLGTELLILHLAFRETLTHKEALGLIKPPFVAFSFYDRAIIPNDGWRDYSSWRRQIASYFDHLSWLRLARHYSEGDVWVRIEPDTNKTELMEFIDTYYDQFRAHLTPTPLFDVHQPSLLEKGRRIRPSKKELSKMQACIKELMTDNTSYQIANILSEEGFAIEADSVRRYISQFNQASNLQFRIA